MGFADCWLSMKQFLLDLGNTDQITFTLLPSFYSNMVLFI